MTDLKHRYSKLLRKYIQMMNHWTQVAGGGMVTPLGLCIPNYASSKSRALTIIEQNLDSYEPDEAAYTALKTELEYSLTCARHSAGNADWVRDTMKEVAKWL
jgi:hypothetical protein